MMHAERRDREEYTERTRDRDREDYPSALADARPADSASPALTILGAGTVRQLTHGGDSDPLREQVQAPGDRTVRARNALAQALVTYRFAGPNAADPKKLVMKNNQINKSKLIEEYNQIVSKGPASIRWAKEHGTPVATPG